MALAETLKATDPAALERAAVIIRRGGVVAVPTETFYGLAADATHAIATARIFEIKGRPQTMALPLVAGSLRQVTSLLGPLDDRTARAAKAFWPGPLSLVVTASPQLSGTMGPANNQQPATSNHSVAIRVPGHAFVRALCARAGTLLTSTSANRTGEPAAETAAAVGASLGGLVDLIVDGGPAAGGKPSTIADLRGETPRLVRDGAIAWERVLELLK